MQFAYGGPSVSLPTGAVQGGVVGVIVVVVSGLVVVTVLGALTSDGVVGPSEAAPPPDAPGEPG